MIQQAFEDESLGGSNEEMALLPHGCFKELQF